MIVSVTAGDNASIVTIEWNDYREPCRIRSVTLGEFAVPESILRSMYDALDFLYGKHRGE